MEAKLWKRLLRAFLYPHAAILSILVPVSAAGVIISLAVLTEQTGAFHYASYVISAYTLTAVCFRAPRLLRTLRRLRDENRLIARWRADHALRVKLSLYASLVFNVTYAGFQLGLGVLHGSVWYYSLAAYYFILALMRFFLVRDLRNKRARETTRTSAWRRYRMCGALLLCMNVALAIIVFFITYWNRGFHHHAITAIAMAAYTFTAGAIAVVNVVRYRRYDSPLYSASKAISLVAAAVSLLTLESTMLNAFGNGMDPVTYQALTAATGIAVCLFVMGTAVYMIAHANRALKREKETNYGRTEA